MLKMKPGKSIKAPYTEETLKELAESAKLLLAIKTANMLSKACPLANGEKCSRDCVHFKEGWVVRTYHVFATPPHYVSEGPTCKLWK